MTENQRFQVTVGVDGSTSSLHAVEWAASEAASRSGTLRIIHAWLWPSCTPRSDLPPAYPAAAWPRTPSDSLTPRPLRPRPPHQDSRCSPRP